mmetsp:Transcript_21088/g.25935  ORF Transcript_21088/g.25935 Transcript_21088/m.25935 type:complete len:201 (+) Transcript_21088:275-877(+)
MTVTMLPSLPVESVYEYFALANVRDQRIVLTGGADEDGLSKKVFMFDLNTEQWLGPQPELNKARRYHGSCSVGDNVFVFGGKGESFDLLDSIEMLAMTGPREWFSFTVSGLSAREQPLVANVSESKILVLGGLGESDILDTTGMIVAVNKSDGGNKEVEHEDARFECQRNSWCASRDGSIVALVEDEAVNLKVVKISADG